MRITSDTFRVSLLNTFTGIEAMNAETIETSGHLPTKLLAVVSAGLFWCVPFSLFLSIAAVKATEKTSGWPRRLAQTGAILTVGWVALLTLGVAWILYIVVWNPALA
jgi:hypothetical protein